MVLFKKNEVSFVAINLSITKLDIIQSFKKKTNLSCIDLLISCLCSLCVFGTIKLVDKSIQK